MIRADTFCTIVDAELDLGNEGAFIGLHLCLREEITLSGMFIQTLGKCMAYGSRMLDVRHFTNFSPSIYNSSQKAQMATSY